jgi:hypothetical protein
MNYSEESRDLTVKSISEQECLIMNVLTLTNTKIEVGWSATEGQPGPKKSKILKANMLKLNEPLTEFDSVEKITDESCLNRAWRNHFIMVSNSLLWE